MFEEQIMNDFLQNISIHSFDRNKMFVIIEIVFLSVVHYCSKWINGIFRIVNVETEFNFRQIFLNTIISGDRNSRFLIINIVTCGFSERTHFPLFKFQIAFNYFCNVKNILLKCYLGNMGNP